MGWFYLYIFTRHFIIEFFFTVLFLLSIHIWICDLILSLFKKHSTFYPFLFIAVLLFVGSETLLFITYLWVMFSYLWVSQCNYLLFPDPVELTFSNTILLSIAASYLCVYSLNGNGFLQHIYFYLAYFAGLLFLFLQVCEYQLLCFYISDSFYEFGPSISVTALNSACSWLDHLGSGRISKTKTFNIVSIYIKQKLILM